MISCRNIISPVGKLGSVCARGATGGASGVRSWGGVHVRRSKLAYPGERPLEG